MPASSLSGATFGPPGLLQLPVEVTQPPVRVQFIRRRYYVSTAPQLPPPTEPPPVEPPPDVWTTRVDVFGAGFFGAGAAAVWNVAVAAAPSGTAWIVVAVASTLTTIAAAAGSAAA